jgi:diaminopimelate decarboxylase
MKLFGTMTVDQGELIIGGVRVSKLAREYGTPLFIFDEQLIRDTADLYRKAFQHPSFSTGVIYAAKAFICTAMAKLVKELSLRLDVVSGGELYTAVRAGFLPEQIYFHGNNKSDKELSDALDVGVGTIVLDNRSEAKRLAALIRDSGVNKQQPVLLRINPGIEAHTHSYIRTATQDSKFGESLHDPAIFDVVSDIASSPELDLYGFHSHIGSQIFEESAYFHSAEEMIRFAAKAGRQSGVNVRTLNFGGGFGVYYTKDDLPLDLASFLPRFLDEIDSLQKKEGLRIREILIEPGRSMINNAGTTLYTIGDLKQTVGGPHFAFVDGGMSDNLRPALYQARYEAAAALKMDEPRDYLYTIAGKLCESGDILFRDIMFPELCPGDLLIVASTGAYSYNMSSNYNGAVRPAVVFVRDGKSVTAVRRQTYEDLLAQDVF